MGNTVVINYKPSGDALREARKTVKKSKGKTFTEAEEERGGRIINVKKLVKETLIPQKEKEMESEKGTERTIGPKH